MHQPHLPIWQVTWLHEFVSFLQAYTCAETRFTLCCRSNDYIGPSPHFQRALPLLNVTFLILFSPFIWLQIKFYCSNECTKRVLLLQFATPTATKYTTIISIPSLIGVPRRTVIYRTETNGNEVHSSWPRGNEPARPRQPSSTLSHSLPPSPRPLHPPLMIDGTWTGLRYFG